MSSSAATALQWIESLVDRDSFIPFSLQYGQEVITGLATVNQRPIALYAHNNQENRGYISSQAAIKICQLMDRAYELKIPIIAFMASPGISIEEGLASGHEYTKVMSKNIAFSGVIPQFAIIAAPTLGAPAYSSALMDFIFFNKHRSFLMVTSPAVVQHAINEKVTLNDLGGANMHASVTGLADFLEDTFALQIQQVKKIINFLPPNYLEHPLLSSPASPKYAWPEIPQNSRKALNMNSIIASIVDNSEWIEYKKGYGQAMICAFAYLQGYPIGILANQSTRLSGAIDCDVSQKSARFIRICDAYNIPILTLIDVPGFMPGKREEQKGLLRYGARFCAAMQTTVPRLSVIIRKCYGAAAYLLMQTRAQGGDLVLALETADIGVMGETTSAKVKKIDQLADENDSRSMNSLENAYNLGLIDEVVKPEQVRQRLGHHLELLYKTQKMPKLQKKHFIDP